MRMHTVHLQGSYGRRQRQTTRKLPIATNVGTRIVPAAHTGAGIWTPTADGWPTGLGIGQDACASSAACSSHAKIAKTILVAGLGLPHPQLGPGRNDSRDVGVDDTPAESRRDRLQLTDAFRIVMRLSFWRERTYLQEEDSVRGARVI